MSRSFPPALAHGPIQNVCDGVFAVRGTYRMGRGVIISRTMTVVRGEDGLVVLNAIRLDEEGEAGLERLGRVKHLVRLSDSHGYDEPYYAHRFAPAVWALKDARLKNLKATRVFGPDGPVSGGTVVDLREAKGWRESSYRVPHGGGTLIACDVLQNHADQEGASFLARLMTPMMGFRGGLIVAPMWRRYQKLAGSALREALRGLTAEPFENLVTGHGPPIVGGADRLVKATIEKASA